VVMLVIFLIVAIAISQLVGRMLPQDWAHRSLLYISLFVEVGLL
jgi:hypothetical protein